MRDEMADAGAGLAVLVVLAIGMWIGSCMGADDAVEEFDQVSCKLACERHRAGRVHSVVTEFDEYRQLEMHTRASGGAT